MLAFLSPGIVDIISSKEAASKTFKIEDREDIDIETKGVAKKSQIFELQLEADTYDTRIDVLKKYTSLLIDLGVMIRKKEIVECLYEYGIMCSYDELKRFRFEVTCDARERVHQNILKPHTNRVVQTVADNFD